MTHPFMKIKLIASAFALIGGTSIVYADRIEFRSQTRFVWAIAQVSGFGLEDLQNELDNPPDLRPFDSMVSVDAMVPTAQAHASASQVSEILPLSVTGSLSTDLSASVEPGGFVDFADATSSFAVSFRLDKPIAYSLEGDASAMDPGFGHVLVALELIGPSDTILSFVLNDGFGRVINTGVLEPGHYLLRAISKNTFISLDEPQTSASSSISFELILPEPTTAVLLAMGSLIALRRRRR